MWEAASKELDEEGKPRFKMEESLRNAVRRSVDKHGTVLTEPDTEKQERFREKKELSAFDNRDALPADNGGGRMGKEQALRAAGVLPDKDWVKGMCSSTQTGAPRLITDAELIAARLYTGPARPRVHKAANRGGPAALARATAPGAAPH